MFHPVYFRDENKFIWYKEKTKIVHTTDYFALSLLDERLLYRLERSQFEAQFLQSPETLPSDVYGGIHLLRLLAQIGKILNRSFSSKMTSDEITQIEKVLLKLIEYLAKHIQAIFNPQNVYVDRILNE